MAKGHYLEKDRLANVIAAIQILGVSEAASGTLDRWAAELEAPEELTPEQLATTPVRFGDRKKWQAIFEQHPEFFKNYTTRGEQRVSLRWRYAQAVNAPPKPKAQAAEPNALAKPDDEYDLSKIPSKPLTPEQMQVLINTAIELHAREVAADRPADRLHTPLMTLVGALLGSVAGGALVVFLSSHPAMVRIFD
jgi:hypothetical protein